MNRRATRSDESRRHDFLSRMQSCGKFRYKRYRGLPLRYAGGKSLAVGHVVEHIPLGVKKIVSPFFGGGSVEIACAKELGIRVCAYDVFDILVNYWRVQLKNPRGLAQKLRRWRPSKPRYEKVKARLKQHWRGERRIADELDLAAHYWFNHNLSYGPGFLGWMSKVYECPARYARLLKTVEAFDCPGLQVARGGFERTIPKHNGDFLYCDPPYYLDGASKMFRGIYPQRNFPVHHNQFKHELLHELLSQHQGGFILSYNDCPEIRKLYADYEIIEVKWQYTLGQGETRIGKNRRQVGADHVKKSHELVVLNRG